MDRVTINISEKKYTPIDPSARWAVANETSLANWWLDEAYKDWKLMVMTNKVCPHGYTNTRDRNYVISKSLWRFIDQHNTPAGRRYARSVGRQICNRDWWEDDIYHGPDTSTASGDPENADRQMNAEPVCFQPNPYLITDESPTHYRVDAYDVDMDFSLLDPNVDNWVNKPWKIVKCQAEDRKGKVFNVMSDLDAFWLTLEHKTGAWIPKNELVLAPDPQQYVVEGSRGVGYRLHGAHWIMGLQNGRQVYVRRVTKAEGKIDYYGWNPRFRSVVPPAWFK